MNQRTIGLAVACLLIGGALIFGLLAGRPGAGEGRELYVTYCASCHGANLQGQPDWKQPLADGTMPAPPHDASGHTWHHADELLFQIIKEGGQGGMPAFGAQLSDDQIWAVLAYIKSTWPPYIQATQREITEQSR
jgi:mono/diheme cytochrome c family protein